MTKQYTNAEMAAIWIHKGQYRRSGEEYVIHPFAVAQLISRYYPGDTVLYCTALFHDGIENCFGFENTGQKIIETIKHMIHAVPSNDAAYSIISNVLCLTKIPGQDYHDYIQKICSGELFEGVLKVKLADMEHNLSTSPSTKQVQKYSVALEHIQSFWGTKPPFVVSSQWKSVWDKIP